MTRDPNSEKAAPLKKQGIEVVKADSWNANELAAAFKGVSGLYVNTDSDDPVGARSVKYICSVQLADGDGRTSRHRLVPASSKWERISSTRQ